MQEIQNAISVKLLLSIITFLLGFNIALIVYMAKKYLKRVDEDHDLLFKIVTEHKIFHKGETNI